MGVRTKVAMLKCAATSRRKRKLPPTFFGREPPGEEQRARAAVLIQRFLRLRRRLAACVDPITQEPIPVAEAVALTEAGGVEQWHSAKSLAGFFLTTANFCNPLSRRQLRCWEVFKIVDRQPRRLRPLLVATYIARAVLQRYKFESEGADLASTTEEALDEMLHGMLADVEGLSFDFRPRSLAHGLRQYEEGLQDLFFLAKLRARALCLRHREVVKNRGFFCPPRLGAELEALQERLVLSRAGDAATTAAAAAPPPMPILKEYLLQRLEFR